MEENPSLSSREKKELRGAAQRMKALVHIGKQGLSETVLAELDRALARDCLVKVRFDVGRGELQALCDQIAKATGSHCVGGVGRTASFYRSKVGEQSSIDDQ